MSQVKTPRDQRTERSASANGEPRTTAAVTALSLMESAQTGDEEAFVELTAPYRRELHLHCYRMLGSITDADDLMQETMLAAWRGLAGFSGQSSLPRWLYQIATNRCLNAIRDRKRRPPPSPVPPFEPPEPSRLEEVTWLEPYPDAWLAADAGPQLQPSARFEAREAVQLAFVTALQRLPPRQTAALLLCDVLEFSLLETATLLEATPTVVKGLLQRARVSLERQNLNRPGPSPEPDSPVAQELAQRFANAFSADDVDTLVTLLTDDAFMAIPPAPHVYEGVEAIADFRRTSAAGRSGRLELVSTRANGAPAFGCYLRLLNDSTARSVGIIVLTLSNDKIAGITFFLNPELPTLFGLRTAPEGRS